MQLTITDTNTNEVNVVDSKATAIVLLDNSITVKYNVGSFGIEVSTMNGTSLGGFEGDTEVKGVLIKVIGYCD